MKIKSILDFMFRLDSRDGRSPNGTSMYMFVVKVLLGQTYICNAPKQYKRPPCTDRACCSDTCTKHTDFYDSVIGTHKHVAPVAGGPTTRLLFREFVVYDLSLCYPEFLVEYERQ